MEAFVLRQRLGRIMGRRGSARPTLWRVTNGYTSFHRAGFSTFHLRGKTYGNVLVGSD